MKIIFSFLFCICAVFCGNNHHAPTQAKGDSVIRIGNNAVTPIDKDSGIVYFSYDNGSTWQNKSRGLPAGIFLSDIAATNQQLAVSTKERGIFLYDFKTNSWRSLPEKTTPTDNVDALAFYHNKLFAGTQHEGVYISIENGKHWKKLNDGLVNLTIRKLVVIDDNLFAGTDGGLFVFDATQATWRNEYGALPLQVNGIADMGNEIFIGTNQGIFKTVKHTNHWLQVLAKRSVHNIAAMDDVVFAMVYNEMFISKDHGLTWETAQNGMPLNKYTFQVRKAGSNILAGQWDGIYHWNGISGWTLYNKGLPEGIPVTELANFGGILVAASSSWYKPGS